MKKTDLAITIATLAYSFLFYNQYAGLNFLLFTVIICSLLTWMKPSVLRSRTGLPALILSLISGIFILLYGSDLSILANWTSLLLFSAYCINDRSSVIFSLLFSLYTIAASLVLMITAVVQSEEKPEGQPKKSRLNGLTYFIPVIFGLIFFFIYKSANPLFEKYTESINLDFLSGKWILFTTGGFFICWALVRHHRIKRIDYWESNLSVSIEPPPETIKKWDEKKAATILFILLNVMLAAINLLDINYLYLGAGMPKGVTHKEFVHHGVGMLILSITLAIGLILYFFRGELNFDQNNKRIRLLIYLWVAQNLLMVGSTCIRNNMYVCDALLTYKRVGVYYWLFMAACGLITTFIKIRNIKSGWFLFRANSVIAYVVLVLSAGVDWDKLIGDYNVSNTKLIAALDKKYLLAISETNIPRLYSIKEKPGFDVDSVYHYKLYRNVSNSQALDDKLYEFLIKRNGAGWRSFNYRDKRVFEEMVRLNSQSGIRSMDLSRSRVPSLVPVQTIFNLKELNLSMCYISALHELSCFLKLERLDLGSSAISSLDSLPPLPKLRSLTADENSINDLRFLERYKLLETLDLSNNKLSDINSFPACRNLKELRLRKNELMDLSPLANAPGIELLSIGEQSVAIGNFPAMPGLKFLELDRMASYAEQTLNALPGCPALEQLNLSYNTIHSLNPLLDISPRHEYQNKRFPQLKYLDLSGNLVDRLMHIDLFPGLEILDVHNNMINNGSGLETLKKLTALYINKNLLSEINFISSLPQLTQLHLNRNPLINDFSPLKHLRRLISLGLSGTRFDDLSLITAHDLKELNLNDCRLKSLKGLQNFTKLETLYISYLKTEDLGIFDSLKRLKKVFISETNRTVINQLQKQFPALSVEYVYDKNLY